MSPRKTTPPPALEEPTPRARRGLLDEGEAASLLGVPPYRMRRWRAGNDGPEYIAFGRTIRYSPGALRRWIDTNTITPNDG